MSERAPRPTRGDFVAWRRVTTRWRDDDAYGHLNNATYYELFDTAVNAYLYEATGVDVRALPRIGVVAETSCRYFRELGFPAPIDTGLVVDRVGTSSVVYRIGLFQGPDGGPEEEAAAEGRFVHVYVDNTHGAGNRPTAPLPPEIRAAVEPLLRP
ncbi:acyl-CoA thioesterase [Nocardioides sp. ChNu-153]|uniref:acyl-CoA thioesterase n=1 Tax=unclassified Nocardioides TaxID=2615069 RepID=UPI0024058BF4|nr:MULTISPECIES: thioesterase family protein [unclassified Nocardioides]MDF9716896.1 acyl-CoA thioesterase [Nocardioides sp. ChNu-99]MDN7122636.1 acyl-CoA thioesterase [Nocardioides sp. ChNu-153]